MQASIATSQMSVCLSVRPSDKRVHCDKTKEGSAPIFKPYERTFVPVFPHEEWLVEEDLLYQKFLANLTPLEQTRQCLIHIRS